ncbi:MAG: alcohol dehydrogenase catalytic domain-containing protein [Verrucomicrobiota bacterium]
MQDSIPATMRAVVYRGANDLRLETVPVPAIQPGELLVKVAVCGVCPTDIKKIQHGALTPPRIFGHETAGVVVKTGTPRRDIRSAPFCVGDRVALHHHVPCLKCHFCRHRAFAQCPQYKRTGITAGFEPAGGGYAEYVRVMPFVLAGVVKIPRRNSFLEGAMLEPVNTVLKAVNRLALLRGDTVLVMGQGPIGLMFTGLLRLRGINVLATDLMDSRLELARQWGAAAAFRGDDASLPRKVSQAAAKWQKWRAKRQPRFIGAADHPTSFLDAAVVAVPSQAAVLQALELVRGSGKVLLFAHTHRGAGAVLHTGAFPQTPHRYYKSDTTDGTDTTDLTDPSDPPSLDLSTICVDEKDLIGSYSSDFTLQNEVASLIFSRKLDIRGLITHQFPLEQTAAAIALASSPVEDSLKLVVNQQLTKE